MIKTCFCILLFLSDHLSLVPSLDRRVGGTPAMPYILVTTQIRLETGPCIVGDENSEPEIMKYLEAEQQREKGQFFKVATPVRLEFKIPD